MKKLFFVAVFILSTGSAVAGDGGGSEGCGLGWQITKKKSFLATTTRQTTNAIVPPTFGMTTGTIGCDQHSLAKKEEKGAVDFVAINYEPLISDMAKGNGEYLHAFYTTMGCNAAGYSSFSSMSQANFSEFSSQSNAVTTFEAIRSKMRQNPALAGNCAVI